MPKLYIIPTPIGNLEDITLRAVRLLKEVDFVIAEDTRVTGNLLRHLQIEKKIFSNHLHNEHQSLQFLIEKIKAATSVALTSDAGTPGISDPGFLLVRECLVQDIEIETLPGATAFVPALVNSGLPCERFTFEGFLPQKKGRQTKIKNLVNEDRTMIFYESPHRILKALTEFAEYFGYKRKASVSREITKKFEETKRGTLEELIAIVAGKELKGEIVIVVEGKPKD
jgi:16S rRNA (cytidine1402-2'-O)-methyltransferase